MPTVVSGYTTEYKSVTTTSDDSSINTEIATQGADSWLVVSLTYKTSDDTVIILFTRTTAAEA